MNQPLKLLLIIPNLSGGGAERVVVTLLRYFDRSRIAPTLLAIDLQGPYLQLLPEEIPVINLQTRRVRQAWPAMIRTINRLAPDVVFSTMDYMNLAVLAGKYLYRGERRPRLVVREANTPTQALRDLPAGRRWLFTRLYRWLYPQADLVITQSVGMQQDLRSFLPRLANDQVVQIYNPLDLSTIRGQLATDTAAKTRDATRQAGKMIVAAGRLTYQKGFDLLLQAFAKVKEHLAEARLVIMGDGPLRTELELLAIRLGIAEQVTFAGFQQNPYHLLQQADLFVLSSRWEGFPNILLEALACGCPVVATDCPSGPGEILQDNRYGLLIERENVDALANGMMRVLAGGITFAAGEERAEAYEASRIAKAYEDSFYRVIHGRVRAVDER